MKLMNCLALPCGVDTNNLHYFLSSALVLPHFLWCILRLHLLALQVHRWRCASDRFWWGGVPTDLIIPANLVASPSTPASESSLSVYPALRGVCVPRLPPFLPSASVGDRPDTSSDRHQKLEQKHHKRHLHPHPVISKTWKHILRSSREFTTQENMW